MELRTYSKSVSISLRRIANMIEIEDTGASVTFHPSDIDKTLTAIILKCNELDPNESVSDTDRRNIEAQLTEIYKDYQEDKDKHRTSDAEHLVYLARSQIKEQFKDQTGAFYVVIERDGHNEMLKTSSDEFDRYLYKLFYDSETKNKVITKNAVNNAKRLLESFTAETRTLYNRIAKIGDAIYYDLNNEEWQCVKITKDGWEIIESPMIFARADLDRKQVQPRLPIEPQDLQSRPRRYVREVIDKFYIKEEYQKTIAEVYLIALFISDISHPIALPNGPPGSGKTLFLGSSRLMVDPRIYNESLVERLPRDEKDRRVAIYNSYFACFDNESHLNQMMMDELCTWVTGFSGSVRELYTTDEMRTFTAKRAIGITGINIPVTNSDALNRAFIVDMDSIPDGFDGTSESKLIGENKFYNEIRKSLPDILAYIFGILVRALSKYDEVEAQIKPNHRLADFVFWGETISRVIGNQDNEFLEAWRKNTVQQNVSVIQNNSFAGLLIDYVLNYRLNETEFDIEPMTLFSELKKRALEKELNISHGNWFPKSPEWISRKIQELKVNLKAADIQVDVRRSPQRRLIHFKKITKNIPIDHYAA